MLRQSLIATLMVVSLAAPAAAKGVLYDCKLDAKRAKGWVSPTMAIVFEDAGTVKVADGALLHYVGHPVVARVRKSGDVARLHWNIAGAHDHVGQVIPTFSYTAKLNLKTLGVSVLAKPVGFPQRFTGKGTCKKRNSTRGFPKG
ncbi:hypothetical protein [Sulfitobacter donghicola]|uniref:Uncharacterized protein n=1 Tax=Sulfitobacter donghicola DSW-25 = KCTC 12864 = JCM 14565 TaxID=1300350 RepID=A0A073IL60_9RHOB|nr:hypothetical protein [Sulfitobacter donghicola]KEJ90330.1 hypothetical protein DSW25_07770 [Sulfitobacter donghicola DSW-25 = KCTC 12864 = JCM 14565]KIN66759.1 hypothetical protein Z948_462 [Sulfitobacter donghicola DSW-25 = KCTC 12864 = JCM 14565]